MHEGGFHAYGPRPERKTLSNRGFGVALALVCAAFATWPVLRGGHPRWPLLAVGALLAALATLRPRWLGPLARVWSAVTRVIERIVGAVVLAIAYFLVLTPVALASRLFGRDPLGLRKRMASYWHRRDETRAPAESMKVQF